MRRDTIQIRMYLVTWMRGAVAGGAVNFVKNRVNGGKDANKDNKDADKKDNEGKKEGDSPKDNNKPN